MDLPPRMTVTPPATPAATSGVYFLNPDGAFVEVNLVECTSARWLVRGRAIPVLRRLATKIFRNMSVAETWQLTRCGTRKKKWKAELFDVSAAFEQSWRFQTSPASKSRLVGKGSRENQSLDRVKAVTLCWTFALYSSWMRILQFWTWLNDRNLIQYDPPDTFL